MVLFFIDPKTLGFIENSVARTEFPSLVFSRVVNHTTAMVSHKQKFHDFAISTPWPRCCQLYEAIRTRTADCLCLWPQHVPHFSPPYRNVIARFHLWAVTRVASSFWQSHPKRVIPTYVDNALKRGCVPSLTVGWCLFALCLLWFDE